MRIGVLGLGFMGSTHLKAWKRIPQAELVAVASDVPQQLTGDLSGIQGNIGGPGEKMDFSAVRKYGNAFEAVEDPEVEAVDICLPTHLHAPVSIAALRAGKHVLVEKPMALDGDSAARMIAEAQAADRILMVAQVLRFIPSYRATAEMVKSGRLGAIRSAFFRRRCAAPSWSLWLSDAAQSGGGVFDLLIHDVDFCLHAFGKPEAVSAVGYEDMARGIDWIEARFQYPGIAGVVVTGGWHHPKAYPFSMEYTVVGDQGTLEYSSAGAPLTLFRADGLPEPVQLPELDCYQAEIEYFVDCCAHARQPEFCPPEESAAAVMLANLMLESRRRAGEALGVE